MILVIGLIYKVIHYASSSSYEFIQTKELKLDRIINLDYKDSIEVTTAVCNKNDTLYHIKYKQFCLLVWSIDIYRNIDKSQIMLDINKRNRNYYFTPYSNWEISPALTLKYKIPDYKPEKILLNLSMDSQVYDSIEYEQEKGYCLRTARFGIGNEKKRSNIIFDFNKEKREVIFMFYNKKNINYLLVFYSYDNLTIDKSILLNMLN